MARLDLLRSVGHEVGHLPLFLYLPFSLDDSAEAGGARRIALGYSMAANSGN